MQSFQGGVLGLEKPLTRVGELLGLEDVGKLFYENKSRILQYLGKNSVDILIV